MPPAIKPAPVDPGAHSERAQSAKKGEGMETDPPPRETEE
jgi:hypothetical protein